ncbi:gluconokinase [Marinitenerispora sediminis]|uniref:gluconokinase n=1 Tax=Marinitenerispora sediminis TaxID=1931232 RepID=A0A368T116_9ACTN|nr:gluconokinase [Marinitenerispora sediminis]RCV50231.1 gluconate kinase [Marinitenerispora sediminis]RCV53502.1 gluconate kinase [Marinitenerispora sediminis]RCV54569.1 gluconate kinase [Marinitenerispora sediminis]
MAGWRASRSRRALALMGVTGTGATGVARLLARALAAAYLEDATDPASADRAARIRRISGWLAEQRAGDVPVVLVCPALGREQRDILRDGDPGLYVVHLSAGREVLARRIRERPETRRAARLLEAQLARLEPLHDDEAGVVIDASASPAELLRRILVMVASPTRVPSVRNPNHPAVS